MQGHDTDKQSNVVSLFTVRDKSAAKAVDQADAEMASNTPETPAFDDVMTKNARNQERMAKERANANKSVLKSYRIKH
ncbi:MAG: hypothetical protein FJ146_00550 [Deltaproteobacteria bacterium]|nr:hypothetical protein [Deltaproteobacteria bacterium]